MYVPRWCHRSRRESLVLGANVVIQAIGNGADKTVPELPALGVSGDTLGYPQRFLPILGQDFSLIKDPEPVQVGAGQRQLMLATNSADHFQVNGREDRVCA